MASSDSFVLLAGGLAVPAEPFLLALELEGRGFTVRREEDRLIVRPHQHLTADDCRRIRQWKFHLLALVDYTPPEVPQ
jgi:hypothetical protein